MGWWDKIWKSRSEEWVFTPIPATATQELSEGYVTVTLRSIRIAHVRKGLKKFYGVAHSFIRASHPKGAHAEFQTVTTPKGLAALDASQLDRVILSDFRLLESFPYNGSGIELELGLFSVAESDLAGPFVGLLTKLSDAAGVTVIETAAPFVPLLRAGVELLTGSSKDALEVGVATTCRREGTFAVVAAPKNVVNPDKLTLGPDGGLLHDGKELVHSYMVFSVTRSDRRSDFANLPWYAELYAELEKSVTVGDPEKAQISFQVLRRRLMITPDLFLNHARKLADDIKARVHAAFPEAFGTGATDALPTFPPRDAYDPFKTS